MPECSLPEWEAFLGEHPQAHVLQSPSWGELKASFGWRVKRLSVGTAGAQVLFRSVGLGFSVAYLPKGPLGKDWAALWPEVDRICRGERAVFLKVEPDLWEGTDGEPQTQQLPGFVPSPQTIQPRRTVVVCLEGEENEILARMKQKTRYNIHLAAKKDVRIRQSQDIGVFYRLMEMTGQRDGFAVHSREYYQRAYELFAPGESCVLLLAEYGQEPLAALMVFRQGRRAWYFYGASGEAERSRMPAYLLQWEAMRWAKQHGCREYDLWGIPDASLEDLEDQFSARSDGLWGVYRFKRGFGGEVRRSVGAWDRVYTPAVYAFYRWWSRRRGTNLA
ncbi:MAG: peptidoglycan bridge formation glycyltransferase FemA/FemB family protein [Chloroflexi bacterium]|nr:peptidoglycan bridge formation glycyltransferase FemA/FemB family protein [Chloroflexota bacterium]